ncbi:hypothetical protein [Geobacter sp. AOG1]|nr:hypothetical protein [Geobacter sp. AOG1]GFE56409.1 hypothetical protein AOG1_02880 [Geobacter sp. AOG1]
MKKLAFVSLALHTMTENKITLELPEQQGLLEILEDAYIELRAKGLVRK